MVVLSLLVAIIFPKFAFVVSFAGSLSESMFFFILPCAVHLKLKFKQMKIYQVCLDVFLIATGIACGIFGIIFSGKAFSVKMTLVGIMPRNSHNQMEAKFDKLYIVRIASCAFLFAGNAMNVPFANVYQINSNLPLISGGQQSAEN